MKLKQYGGNNGLHCWNFATDYGSSNHNISSYPLYEEIE